MRLVGLAATLLAIAAPVSAQSMNADTFTTRAMALKAKGPLALFHKGEIDALMQEVKGAIRTARTRRLAAINAGQPPLYCPPADARGLSTDDLMNGLNAIPAPDRRKMTMADAMVRILHSKYPCTV